MFAAGIPARMLEGLAPMDLTGIGVLPGPMRQMMGVDHAFTDPSDFEGTVVGTSGGDLSERTLRALGATPQMMPAQTSLDGLEGLEFQLSGMYGNRYYEHAAHVSANLNLWLRPLVIFIDSDRYGDLTDEQQAILRGAAEASIAPASEATRVDEAEGGAGLCCSRDQRRARQRCRSGCAARGRRSGVRRAGGGQRDTVVPRGDSHREDADGR